MNFAESLAANLPVVVVCTDCGAQMKCRPAVSMDPERRGKSVWLGVDPHDCAGPSEKAVQRKERAA